VIELRDDQTELIDRTRDSMRNHNSVLMQAPTGAGKTIMAAYMASRRNDVNVLFSCHRSELILQSSLSFRKFKIPHSYVATKMRFNPNDRIHIGMIQSINRRIDKLREPDLLIMDECHHIAAKSWNRILDAWPNTRVVGLSATPQRLDGKGLDEWFDDLIVGPSVLELQEAGHLSGYKCFSFDPPDMTGVTKQIGDFKQKPMAERMGTPKIVGDIVDHWLQYAEGMKTIGFFSSIENSIKQAEMFNAAGISAAHVDGKTPAGKRSAILRKFARGLITVVCNVGLFDEGYDLAANAGIPCTVECVIDASPTESLSKWIQKCGRALRPKDFPAIILDHAGNFWRHGPPNMNRDWTLQGRTKKAKGSPAYPVKQCPGPCFFTYPSHLKSCPECGYEPPIVYRDLEHVKGSLSEVDSSIREEVQAIRTKQNRKAYTLKDMIQLGIKRGYEWPRKWAEREHKRQERRRRYAG